VALLDDRAREACETCDACEVTLALRERGAYSAIGPTEASTEMLRTRSVNLDSFSPSAVWIETASSATGAGSEGDIVGLERLGVR